MPSRQQEAHAQNRIAEQAEVVAANRFTNLIEQAMLGSVVRYEAGGALTIPDSHRPDVEIALADAWGRSGRLVGQFVIGQFKGGYAHLETKIDEESLFQRILREFIEQFGAMRVEQITTATMESMQRIIAQGAKEGLGVVEIAKRIRDNIPLISRIRANVIARTETHSASQHASIEVAKTSRLSLEKEWVSVEDHRTRDFGEGDGVIDEFSHRAMNGQRVQLDQFYKIPRRDGTFENMMYPGDPNGSAGDVINCRCASVFRRAD